MRSSRAAAAVRIGALLTAACLSAWPASARAEGVEAVVYYQVTYADGSVRDLSEPPAGRVGIRRVIRIARVETAGPGYRVLSAGAYLPRFLETGRTVQRELRWNGRAWVARRAPRARPGVGPTSRPAPVADGRRSDRAEGLRRRLRAATARLRVFEQAIAQAAELLTKVRGTGRESAAMLLLEQAQAARRKCLRTIAELERRLEAAGADGSALGQAVGKVAPAPGALGEGALGVVRPLRRRRVLPHRAHVWRLPPARGRRTYVASMAHPEAGLLGAFYYVAYADSDGDGAPDTLIARSPLAVADAPGRWSRWSFTTDAADVFVGCAWPYADAAVYHGPLTDRDGWRGLGTEVYVSGSVAGLPWRRWPWPYFTNLRVQVRSRNGDVPSPARPSRIIVR